MSSRFTTGFTWPAENYLDPADLLVLKPGSKVSIRMETNYTPGDNQKAFDAISKKLRDNGVEAVQSSSLVVVALSKKGKPREQTYSSFRSFEKTTRTITPLIYSLTMYEGQNNIYQTSGSGGLLA